MTSKEETLIKKTEKELENLKYELEVCREAKKMSEACSNLRDFSEGEEEPFSSSYTDAISWHKNPGGGGGCIILWDSRS